MHSSLEQTVTSLLAAHGHRDVDRQTELYERAAPALYSWVALNLRGGLRARIDAEEVAQETWARALRNLSSFDPAQGTFRSWLLGIARNVLMEVFQTLRKHSQVGGSTTRQFALANYPDSVTSVTRRVAREDALRQFIERVGDMGEDEQVLVLSCGIEGLTSAEAAARLGITPDAALKRWQRLRATLAANRLPLDLLAPNVN